MAQTFDLDTLLPPLLASEGAAWSMLFFNVPLAKALLKVDRNVAEQLLLAGAARRGAGWTKWSAAKRVWEVAGVPLVGGQFSTYINAWLFALALCFGVDVKTLAVTDRGSEAAFNVME